MRGVSAAASPVRVAMWSGPRNISTAMMRSWENRGDTAVWDEPFYAYYLDSTGIEHPVDSEVIAAGETCPRALLERHEATLPETAFFNEYGPTEATVGALTYRVERDAAERAEALGVDQEGQADPGQTRGHVAKAEAPTEIKGLARAPDPLEQPKQAGEGGQQQGKEVERREGPGRRGAE